MSTHSSVDQPEPSPRTVPTPALPIDPLTMVGQVLHGQFRVDEVVAVSKRSVVYRGMHLMLEVPIAIKCMVPPADEMQEQFIRRFRHDTRLQYKLSQASPHVVRVLASGTAVASTMNSLVPFVVLEWLDGEPLSEQLAARRAAGARGRALGEAVRLLEPVAEALALAHAHGVVHRDLRPEKLFVARVEGSERLKILDFGVAKMLGEQAFDVAPMSQTAGFMPVASPAYGAPEQFESGLGEVGPPTDVYAVAIVLLELLRDQPVLLPASLPVLAAKITDPKHRPTARALGISLGDVASATLARAVALRPGDRPRDVGELWGMLKNALAREGLDDEQEAPTMVCELSAAMELAIPSSRGGPVERTKVMDLAELRKMGSRFVDDVEPVSKEEDLFVVTTLQPLMPVSPPWTPPAPRPPAPAPAPTNNLPYVVVVGAVLVLLAVGGICIALLVTH